MKEIGVLGDGHLKVCQSLGAYLLDGLVELPSQLQPCEVSKLHELTLGESSGSITFC